MRVKCIKKEKMRIKDIETINAYEVSFSKIYIVLGISCYFKDKYYGDGVFLHLRNDSGSWIKLPIIYFEVVEDNNSRFWHSKFVKETEFVFWPKEFFKEFYFERLTDGEIELEEGFLKLYDLIENEVEK